MTDVALLCGLNVINALARGNHTIVTTRTGAYYLRVIHRARRHRYPFGRRHRMARFAHFSAGNVRRALAARGGAIMAIHAIAGDRAVINRRSQPLRHHMTGIAFLRGWHVQQVLARRRRAIMTARTDTRYLGVINRASGYGDPFSRSNCVASFAHIGSGNVCITLAAGSAAVVAANTISSDSAVVYGCT